jgi:hypothetical protein
VSEDSLGEFLDRALATFSEQRHQHDGLVDMGHPHAVLYEVRELLVRSHVNTLHRDG